MNMFTRKILLTLVFLFASFSAAARQAHALSFGGIGIRASAGDWFIYSLGPGEKQEDYVEVFNYTEESQRLIIQAYDSEPSNIGAFALTGPNNVQKGIGVWVKLETNEIVLEPGEARRVKFTIEIPENADVGEHSGAITAITTQYKQVKGMQGAAVGTRVGARVYNTVPGEIIRKISLVSFDVSENILKNEFDVQLTAKNEGNITVTPVARLYIDGFGLKTRRKPFLNQVLDTNWQLLRGATVTTYWQAPRPYFGRYTLYVTLDYEEKENVPARLTTQKITFTIIPWRDTAIAGGALLFIIAVIVFWILYRKKKYSGKGWESYTVKATDNIMTLSQECSIPWKTFVKVNKIKKPYFLKAGSTILVPPGTLGAKSLRKDKKEGASKTKTQKRDLVKILILVSIIILTTLVLIVGIIIFVRSVQFGNLDEKANFPIQEAGESSPSPSPAQADSSQSATSTPSEPASTPTPTPSPQTQAKKEEISVKVLNGSGVAGLAGVYAQKLKDAGFIKIETGNADNFQYKDIEIRYTAKMKSAAEEISLILQKDYKNIMLKETEVSGSDIQVIVGSR